MRLVVTYTTLPGRYHKLLTSIQSLQAQKIKIDKIYLSLPQRVKRTGEMYPPLPEDLKSLCEVVHPPEDFGPLTKVYAAIECEKEPDTLILSCDDDTTFSPGYLEKMLSCAEISP